MDTGRDTPEQPGERVSRGGCRRAAKRVFTYRRAGRPGPSETRGAFAVLLQPHLTEEQPRYAPQLDPFWVSVEDI